MNIAPCGVNIIFYTSNTPLIHSKICRQASALCSLLGVAHLGAQKGGQNSSIALDETCHGAILRVHLGPLNRTFPAQYSPASTLRIETPYFGPQARVFLSRPNTKGRNGAKTEPAMGMAGGMPKGP